MSIDLRRAVILPVAKSLVPLGVQEWIRDIRNARRVDRNPARILLVEKILPAYARLGGRILFVGCRRYTRRYPHLLESGGGECWTTDLEPEHARWGNPGRHLTADLLEIDGQIPAASLDTVLVNGVFGFGIDTAKMQRAAIEAVARVLKPGGRLLIGWNTERVADPTELDIAKSAFDADDLPGFGGRAVVPEAGYVYAFLRRRAGT